MVHDRKIHRRGPQRAAEKEAVSFQPSASSGWLGLSEVFGWLGLSEVYGWLGLSEAKPRSSHCPTRWGR